MFAFLKSKLSSIESALILRLFEASHGSLMLGFLLVWRRWRLVNAILAALCAKVGIPSPQKLMGGLAHSETQELGGNSNHYLMCFGRNLPTTPDMKESVKS